MLAELLAWRLRRLRRRVGLAGAASLAVLAVVVLAAALSPLLGYRPGFDVDVTAAGLPPSLAHPLGTDHLGRDTARRLLLACRSFALPGLGACLVACALAIPAGAVAGWYGGLVAGAIRYLATVVASVPRFVLVLLIVTIFGDDLAVLAVAAGLAYAPTLAEDVFARIEGLRASEHLLAARAHGVPEWRVLWLHLVVGACGGLVARHLVLLFGFVLVLETTLSYVGGFGVQEPVPSWGNMLAFEWGRDGSWAARAAPAVALWATVAATTTAAGLLGGRDD